jgi:hypothetical protein
VALARGTPLPDAVAQAKAWVLGRIEAAQTVGEERRLPG